MAQAPKNPGFRLSKPEFAQISADLRNRGFVDALPADGEGRAVRYEGFPVYRLSRRISGFDLNVELSMMLNTAQGQAGNEYSMRVGFESLANRNVDMLLRCFRAKSHYRTNNEYTATLVSSLDAGLLIRNGLALEDALSIVRADSGMLDALDASETADKLEDGLKAVDPANRFKAAAAAHLGPFIAGCRRRFEEAMQRLACDPRIQAAMESLAERE
jgi:hypothetical protein